MVNPEKVVMKGSAQALALDPDRIAGGSCTRRSLSIEDVGLALAGMKEARVPHSVVQRVHVALQYMTLGQDDSRWDLYRLLLIEAKRAVDRGRWPERVDGRLYHEALSTLAIYAYAIPPLDHLLKGQDAPTWLRDFAPKYKELREAMDGWERLGLAHVRRRTDGDPDEDG